MAASKPRDAREGVQPECRYPREVGGYRTCPPYLTSVWEGSEFPILHREDVWERAGVDVWEGKRLRRWRPAMRP